MGEMDFDNKRSRLWELVKGIIGVLSITAIGLLTSNRAILKGNGIKLNVDLLLFVITAALVIGFVLGLVNFLKTPKMKITVTKKGVEVIRGTAEGYYKLEKYRGYETTTKNKKTFGTLIFEDDDETDDEYLLIDCDGFPFGDFRLISDCIRIYKYNVLDEGRDAPKDMLEEDHYLGSDQKEENLKKTRKFFIFAIIVLVLLNAGLCFYEIKKHGVTGSLDIFFLQGVGILFLAGITIYLYKSPTLLSVKDLFLTPTEIKINDETWTFKNIESVYITPPYLESKEEAERNIYITAKDTGKKSYYYIENRPVTYDPEDKYNRLYNSIIDLCKRNSVKVEEIKS